jgi:hypothetical protein
MTVTRPSDKSGMSEAGQRRLHVEALPEIGSLSEVTIGIIEFMGIVTGPIRRGDGIAPAVALVDPKFPHNVGAAVRAASCYGVRQVWFSGDRVRLDGARRQRLPREERMRGYKERCSTTGTPSGSMTAWNCRTRPQATAMSRTIPTLSESAGAASSVGYTRSIRTMVIRLSSTSYRTR